MSKTKNKCCVAAQLLFTIMRKFKQKQDENLEEERRKKFAELLQKMYNQRRHNDTVNWYLGDMTSKIVARSGRPTDRYHLGKMILHGLRAQPDMLLQIDGATGEKESYKSVLERSVLCASCMKNYGLQTGDVIILMAPNHLDLCIPLYAALYLGVIVSAVDRTLVTAELQATFNTSRPKMIFCQSARAPDVQLALNEIDLDAQIVTFDKGDYLCTFSDFLDKYVNGTNSDDFEGSEFDASDAIAYLIATSGTTGMPKAAAVTHKNFALAISYMWSRYWQFPTPTKVTLIGSPLQWLTALLNFTFTPVMGFTRLQSTLPLDQHHCYDLINKYRPTWTVFSPTLMTSLVKQPDCQECDFTCFDTILLGGSAVPEELIQEIKALTPDTKVFNVFGMSETAGTAFLISDSPPGSSGTFIGCLQYRLINVETGDDIYEANVSGELWLKGPMIFKGYYNNISATEDTFSEDGWLRTGDMFYRDENYYFYFVERIKLLLKYKSHQISPLEIESVIRTHPSVLDVAVSSIADPECGDLPVACVVTRHGHHVSAQEIKDLVKDNLTDSKQLRGGVIFMSEIPMTASTKVHRRKLKAMVQDMERE